MRLLLVEDDHEAANWLIKGLREEGFEIDYADNGADGLSSAQHKVYDVIIMDRMLPKLDGFSIVQKIREKKIQTPVLFLSALSEVDDKVAGLRIGADDYLAKPYVFTELVARIETLIRRKKRDLETTIITVNDLEIDLLARTATRSGENIPLQPTEFKLLEYLVRNAGTIVTRTMLLENVWNYHFDPLTNIIDVHVSRLRNKIDKGFASSLLRTVRGEGYMLGDRNK